MSRVFADHVASYALAGWPCVLPVPRKKSPPPEGFTGAAGADTAPLQLVAWAGSHADYSIAVRLPEGIIGIDADHYDKKTRKGVVAKRGGDTVAAYEAEWGPLPATWTCTARGTEAGPGPSRIAFYKVPPGRYRTTLGDDVEIIQRHHRYAVVAPSPHPDLGGAVYRWYDPAGRPSEAPPKPDELTTMPQAWTAGLREGAAEVGPAPAPVGEGQALLAAVLADNRTAGGYAECAEVSDARQIALHELGKVDPGSRHDTAIARVHRLIHLGAAGHVGAGGALALVGAAWAELTEGEDRAGEWERMMLTSARKAATVVGVVPVGIDPCTVMGGAVLAAPAPVDDRGEGADAGGLPGPIAPAGLWSVRQVIGAHAFDPRGSLDQTLAQAVLERTYPGLRYAYDSGQWLLRRQHVWEAGGDLSRWAVGELAELMPHGDPDAHKDTLEFLQAGRRKRFMSRGPAAGVAGKMVDLVVGGTHPCSVRMSDLDAEPDVIWAGGVAWDIRASAQGCVPAAGIGTDTPHLHAAGVAPLDQPTPRWDAFLAAVWPNPEIRAWAKRVLAVTVTGFSDKALPILLGQTDRGKSQVVVLLMSVLGTYAHAADPRLLAGADSAHASIVHALKGRRLSFVDEGPREGKWAQERLKQLTGGTELTGNRMRENPITFTPTHTLVLTANDEPVLTDPAIRRRVRLIPCEGDPDQVRATRAAIGHLSSPAWRKEAPGVLADMIREAGRWLADESSASTAAAPAQMRYLAEALAAEQDPIKAWVQEDTEPWEEGTRAGVLFEAFVNRCVRQNIPRGRIPSVQKWGRELTAMGLTKRHDREGSLWPLRLRDDGGWWRPGGASVTDVGRDVTARDSSPSGSVTDQNARSDSVFSGVVTDVTDIHTQSTDTKNTTTSTQRTTPHTQKRGESEFYPPLSQPYDKAGSDLQERGVTVSITGVTDPSQPSQGYEAPSAAKIRDHASAQHDSVSPAPTADKKATTAQVHIPSQLPDAPGVMVLDLETGDAKTRHDTDPTTFVRIAGLDVDNIYSDTTDMAAVARAVGAAGLVVTHNGISFDLPALEAAAPGHIDLLAMTRKHRVLDTMVTEAVLDPPESDDLPNAVARAMVRYGLDAIAARRGLPGKTDDLKGLAKRHGGFDAIPVDDPEYRAYLRGDVAADKALAAVQVPYITPYVWREHRVAAIAATMSEAGLLVDEPLLRQRYNDTEARKQALAAELADRHDIPITDAKGKPRKSPQASKDGKAAIVAAFHKLGVDDADLPRTPKRQYALGGDGMRELAVRYGGEVAQLCEVVAGMSGSRTVYGTALDNLHTDGRVHPSITMYQASGRWSTTKPGLTVFGKRGGRVVERAVFVAGERKVLLAADLSQIDARAIAVHSQDHAYMDLFLPGVDSHVEVAKMVWNDPSRRQDAKAIGHGWNYGMGLDKLAATAGVPDAVAVKFDLTMQYQFPRLVAWRDWIREVARRGVLDNGFGRIMRCNPRRAYTQGPALMGQGTARDLMMECLLRLPDDIIAMLRIQVHDEIILEVAEEEVAEVSAELRKAMTFEWAPPGASRPITVEADISGYGKSWADCYKK